MLINFTSPTCVTVTDAAEEGAVELAETAPGNGGDFKGEAPERTGRVGKATGALLTTTGAGAETGVVAGAVTTAAGFGTLGRTKGGAT